MEIIKAIARSLEREIGWFETVVKTALSIYFENDHNVKSVYDHTPPVLDKDASAYAELIKKLNLGFEDRLLLILALLPIVKPQALDVFLIKNQNLNNDFSEFGGIKGAGISGFTPSLKTACFILSGSSLEERLRLIKLFQKDHVLYKKGILVYDGSNEFALQQRLNVSPEFIEFLTEGKMKLPEIISGLPAREISTELEWDDLIIDQQLRSNLEEIKDWLIHSEVILEDWGLHKTLKKGYRALFYGPSGTGKTMAATLIGKSTKRPVFRIDLSLLVTKYIGETEKNLEKLFNEAENKDWILFFDEADALFGKRTQVKSANDRYANQEVSYLLQRMEEFSGLVILATNLKTNIDEAFARRFQSMVHFQKPQENERLLLWKRLFEKTFSLEGDVDLDQLAENYELTRGEMINIQRYCALVAAKRGDKKIGLQDLIAGIRREYSKSNKTL
ncbi:MAG: ATP-binding protein [Flavobacterium sp.]|nr:MAG: ATP-binding protein [Flavobacterium sp.]